METASAASDTASTPPLRKRLGTKVIGARSFSPRVGTVKAILPRMRATKRVTTLLLLLLTALSLSAAGAAQDSAKNTPQRRRDAQGGYRPDASPLRAGAAVLQEGLRAERQDLSRRTVRDDGRVSRPRCAQERPGSV